MEVTKTVEDVKWDDVTFEIKDEEIDVQKIMERIRDNIKRRKQQGGYSEVRALLQEPRFQQRVSSAPSDELRRHLHEANIGYQVQVRRPILSYRRIVGRLLVRIRMVLQQEIRWTLDPIVDRQEYFNARVVQVLNALTDSVGKLQSDQNALTDSVGKLQSDQNALTDSVGKLQRDQARDNWNDISIDFTSFQQRFRGTEEEIRGRFSIYLEFYHNCTNVLDIGCGRGEMLELLTKNGIAASGVDTEASAIQTCREKGLDVRQVDALSYLASLEDACLDGIFCSHVIEHLRPPDLVELVRLCHAKLRSGAYLVIETPNPLSLVTASQAFYIDLSHVKPVHPETLRFLLDSTGFKNVELRFFHSWPGSMKLAAIKSFPGADPRIALLARQVDRNFEKLNDMLLGNQDYAAIGRRA